MVRGRVFLSESFSASMPLTRILTFQPTSLEINVTMGYCLLTVFILYFFLKGRWVQEVVVSRSLSRLPNRRICTCEFLLGDYFSMIGYFYTGFNSL